MLPSVYFRNECDAGVFEFDDPLHRPFQGEGSTQLVRVDVLLSFAAGPLSKEAGTPSWPPCGEYRNGFDPMRLVLAVSLGGGGRGGLDVFQLWIRWPGPGMAAVLF